MDELLDHGTDEFELVVEIVGEATEGIPVECGKCGTALRAAIQPTKKPACSRCYEIVKGLKVARAQGFRTGF